jgi:hypothetical protein
MAPSCRVSIVELPLKETREVAMTASRERKKKTYFKNWVTQGNAKSFRNGIQAHIKPTSKYKSERKQNRKAQEAVIDTD